MMVPIEDGQIDPKVVAARDAACGVNTAARREARRQHIQVGGSV